MNSEIHQLSTLLVAIKQQLEKADPEAHYEITIGDTIVSLACGGPQLEGLYCLVDQIATENLYTVDYKNNLVID